MQNPQPIPQQATTVSPQPKQQPPSPEKAQKTEKEMKKEKRKKQKALKQFLSKPQNDIIEVPRRTEEEPTQQSSQQNSPCKICGDFAQKRKQCQFCKDSVCTSHIRKKRKHKKTGKFVRICDDCDDKMIYDKYMNLESKAEQALLMQQMIIQGKHDQLTELVMSKKVKIGVLNAKKKQLEEEKKEQNHKNKQQEHDIAIKEKRFQHKLIELTALEEQAKKMEENLPRPLDDDYNCLVDQNNKINKELLKYEKLCSQALKAKSTRQKELYDAYYKWQKKETTKSQNTKKKDDCLIY